MLRLGVVSDSHGHGRNLEKAAAVLADCDAVAHLGDLTSDAAWLAARMGKPLYAVRGNCDGMSAAAPEEMTIALMGIRLLLAHGHRFGAKQGLTRLWLRAREAGAQVALYGHTHVPSAECEGGILLLNPGALMDGRCAVLEFRENGPVHAMKIL